MALINGLYIHVTDEKINKDTDVSSHSVESGIDVTDTVKPKQIEISLSGKIVDVPGENGTSAFTVLQQLRQFQNTGALVDYSGRNAMSGYQITSLSTSHNGDVSGGASFDMTLREFRVAQNSYTPSIDESQDANDAVTDGGNQAAESGESSEVWYTTQDGDTVWALVAAPNAVYKSLVREGQEDGEMGACNWVMANNLHAFSRAWDFRTMQNGVSILLGRRNDYGGENENTDNESPVALQN